MKLQLNSEKFLPNGITDSELFLLLFYYTEGDIGTVKQSLISKGFITQDGSIFNNMRVTESGKETINTIIAESSLSQDTVSNDEMLAMQLRSLFPEGSKAPGHTWKSSAREVSLKLKRWRVLYGKTVMDDGTIHQWTNDEIFEATKRYVESFNGNYKFMRTLKYFILKYEIKATEEGGVREETSDLASVLNSTEDEVKQMGNDWTSTVI